MADEMKKDQIMTVKETAELMRVNRATVLNWIKSGKLQSFKAGLSIRILKSDIYANFEHRNEMSR